MNEPQFKPDKIRNWRITATEVPGYTDDQIREIARQLGVQLSKKTLKDLEDELNAAAHSYFASMTMLNGDPLPKDWNWFDTNPNSKPEDRIGDISSWDKLTQEEKKAKCREIVRREAIRQNAATAGVPRPEPSKVAEELEALLKHATVLWERLSTSDLLKVYVGPEEVRALENLVPSLKRGYERAKAGVNEPTKKSAAVRAKKSTEACANPRTEALNRLILQLLDIYKPHASENFSRVTLHMRDFLRLALTPVLNETITDDRLRKDVIAARDWLRTS